uniref:Uncharacterized protein n=1 Tax=Tanacetum cinerariifolium TaxID=118510 RepID=A0A6L2M3E0_TANCI|nr:hypothetical protein [Tanacetum cinerariifolium]
MAASTPKLTVRIEVFEEGQTDQHAKKLIADDKRSSLLERVTALKGSNTRLRDTLGESKTLDDKDFLDEESELSALDEIMTINHSGMNPEAIKELISRRVEEALVAQEANRNAGLISKNQSQNGDDDDNRSRGNGNHGNNNGDRNQNRGNGGAR